MNKRRKITTLLFLWLANMIILTHAAVAHHHYENECNSLDHNHFDDLKATDECHIPCCHGSIEKCLLSINYLISRDDIQCCTDSSDYDLLPCFLILFSGYSVSEIDNDIGLPFRQNPYILSHYIEYIAQPLRLRAPPYC